MSEFKEQMIIRYWDGTEARGNDLVLIDEKLTMDASSTEASPKISSPQLKRTA